MDTNKNTETNDTNERNDQWETTGEQADELTPQSTGRWLITTEHSLHIWDLDEMTYTRLPKLPEAQPHAHDETVVNIYRVVRWPKVGARPYLWFDDPEHPKNLRDWRINTTVLKIERLVDTSQATTNAEDPA